MKVCTKCSAEKPLDDFLLGDNPDNIQAAANYVRRHSMRKVA